MSKRYYSTQEEEPSCILLHSFFLENIVLSNIDTNSEIDTLYRTLHFSSQSTSVDYINIIQLGIFNEALPPRKK